ncbi:MAG: peptidase C1 [Bacteroidia bacterium]|nr:peptidase C1 [Bacteroidia bacterium]
MKYIFIIFLIIIFIHSQGQNKKDTLIFKKFVPGLFHNEILKDVQDLETQPKDAEPWKYITVDFSDKKFPGSLESYKTVWHNASVSQGNSGTCWCYSPTSFFESEVFRISGEKVKLSEMYTVYWEYVERANDFVHTRGETYFAQGSESNAIPKIWRKYGIVPYNDYPGKENTKKFHNHEKMFDEMKQFLDNIKENNIWDQNYVKKNITTILNKYMGCPPEKIIVEGKEFSPQEYLTIYLKLNMNDYFSFMSTCQENFYELHELVEADNWWHAKNYYNISLQEFFNLIIKTIEAGYSISICGDVSEPGNDFTTGISIIPSFDIPPEFIDDNTRQFRLSNNNTTDDHCVHLIGYCKTAHEYWFLVKDSGSSAFDSPNKGYRIYHQDYIRLKMMNILIHKDTAKEILDKIIK